MPTCGYFRPAMDAGRTVQTATDAVFNCPSHLLRTLKGLGGGAEAFQEPLNTLEITMNYDS